MQKKDDYWFAVGSNFGTVLINAIKFTAGGFYSAIYEGCVSDKSKSEPKKTKGFFLVPAEVDESYFADAQAKGKTSFIVPGGARGSAAQLTPCLSYKEAL